MRDNSLNIQFVPAERYEMMQDQYNSSYHSDMQHVGQREYDGVDTWLEAARSFMKQPPWGQVTLSGECLEEVKELGNLANVDPSRIPRAVKNSLYLPSLINSIDDCIVQHRKETNSSSVASLIFCRLNECSMKQSTDYKVHPFSDGSEILDRLLRDLRVISWLSQAKYNIRSTTIYLSDFDPAFATKNEYRVFVWRGKVTGISQYRWFPTDETEYHTEESARCISEDILCLMEGDDGLLLHLRDHSRKKQSRQDLTREHEDEIALVADVVHTEGRVYLVEINLFGGETGCGSSLFHWKRDEPVLYGDSKNVVCRFLAQT